MNPKGIGKSGWLQRAAQQRLAAAEKQAEKAGQKRAGGVKGVGLGPAAGLDQGLQGQLEAAKVPPAVVAKHGASLAGALEPAARVTAHGAKLEAWRARTFDRAVGQLYKTLGPALDALPEARRPEAAKRTLTAFAELVTSAGTGDALIPALNSAVGMFEGSLRLARQKRLALTDADRVGAFEGAAAAVLSLKDQLGGRAGTATALNLYPNLVEMIARGGGELDAAGLAALLSRVATLIVQVAPKTGVSLQDAAELSRIVSERAGKKMGKADAFQAAVAKEFSARFEPARADLEAQIAQDEPALAANTPARAAFDALNAALTKMVQAHPAGPETLYPALHDLRGLVVNRLRAEARVAEPPKHAVAVTALLEAFGSTELAGELVALINLNHALIVARPLAADALIAAAKAGASGEGARQLALALIAAAGQTPERHPGLVEALDALAELPAQISLLSVFGARDQLRAPSALTGAVLEHVSRLAGLGERDDPAPFLRDFATKDAAFLGSLQRYNVRAQDPVARQRIAEALGRAAGGTDAVQAANGANQAVAMLQAIERSFPKATLEALVGEDAEGRAGLYKLADPTVHWRTPPAQVVNQITAALARTGVAHLDGELQTSALRDAFVLTSVVAYLDGDHRIPFARILPDYEAAYRDPTKLAWAPKANGALAARARNAPTVEGFLEAHAALPRELAFTAGVHLEPAQVAWLVERVEAAHGRDTVRQLRDFVFACVTFNRKDLLAALIASKTPPKAQSRVISVVARDYRDGKHNQIPYDRLIAGLNAGEDPVNALEDERVKAALGGLVLNAPTPEGLAELSKSAEAIRFLLEYTKPNQQFDGLTGAMMKEPFEAALQSVADGTWPKVKYENEVGKRMLASLSPAQQAAWRQETVVSADAPAAPGGGDAHGRAMTLLKGLAQKLPAVKLPDVGLGKLKWDAASLDSVREKLAEEVKNVRAAKKGTDAHRAAGRALGPLRQAVALLSLSEAIRVADADPKRALAELRGPLSDAIPALRSVRFSAALEIVNDALHLAKSASGAARGGTYAVDEDALEPLLMSTTGGCIVYNGVRRWANINLAVNANEKILRVYEGAQFKYRACLKIFDVKLDGYEGPVLWVNQPNANAGGTAQHRDLLIRQAITKAQAMGIPVASRYATMAAVAQTMGLQAAQSNGTLIVDDGNTGSTYVDYLFGNHNLVQARGQNPKYSIALQMEVIMPKKRAEV